MNLKTQLIIGLSASSLIIIAGCRDNPTTDTSTTTGANNTAAPRVDPNATTTTTPNNGTTGTMNNTTGMNPTNGTAPMDTSGSTTLADSQLIQVTHFANVGEIAQAKMAQDKTKNADVKKFAEHMITDHTDADTKGMDLSKKENFTLQDSPISANLKVTADKFTADMTSKTGADFDKSYVDAQVQEHQAVLDTLDNKLIPAAKDADVKSYLQDVRKSVAKHLDHAKKLQGDLAKQ